MKTQCSKGVRFLIVLWLMVWAVAPRATALAAAQAGVHFEILKSFSLSSPGGEPQGTLVIGTDGALYGTTVFDGVYGLGSVFRVTKDGSGYAILHSFSNREGIEPAAGLLEASDGALYGTTSGGGEEGGAIFKLNKNGSGFTLLHSFNSRVGDGAAPSCQLIEGSDGALYGTT